MGVGLLTDHSGFRRCEGPILHHALLSFICPVVERGHGDLGLGCRIGSVVEWLNVFELLAGYRLTLRHKKVTARDLVWDPEMTQLFHFSLDLTSTTK